MKKLSLVLTLSLIVGCGAVQNWSGTYEGTSKRAASATELEAATAVKETWKISEDVNKDVLSITRERAGDAACALLGSRAGSEHGGYGARLNADQKCVINGTEHILVSGELQYLGPDVEFDLQWKTSAAGGVVLVEQGTFAKK
ncbi:hypothetical protein [Archangium lansingense]|uniref:Lipoprotein n=1 Tax=Archangium lansingense TaxID=2995310 RepID=A0ABT4A0U5_9BACT|nr:hypothetical protein [Archangium lansinium]MCY1075270.1 hypothetical protein [Archangium lansinium]